MSRNFSIVLYGVAPLFLLIGGLHLTFGLGVDVWLGAKLPVAAIVDPALDSQNRFYGVAFALYGVFFFLCATNLAQYATVLRCVLWGIFAGGLARLISIVRYGFPPPWILALLVAELLLPPLFVWWLARVETEHYPDVSSHAPTLAGR